MLIKHHKMSIYIYIYIYIYKTFEEKALTKTITCKVITE